ncbi:hypothetical protein, partial [Enterobacter asburiae]
MTVTDISQLIKTIGFPIVCGIGMAWYIYETNKSQREDIKSLNEQQKQEMNQVVEALNNNTVAFAKLYEKLDNI